MSDSRQDFPNNNEGRREQPDYRPPGEGWNNSRGERRPDWRRRDPFRGLFPGLILILLGVTLFLANQGLLSWTNWWQYFLIGLGGIFLLDGLLHYLHPDFRRQSAGRFIPGIILVLVGAAFVIGFSEWWPLILVGVGVAILLGMLFRRR